MKTETIERWTADVGGTALMAIGIQCFLEPAQLVAGGITGLGILLDAWTRITFGFPTPLWLINIGLNLPLFLLSWKYKGGRFVGRTMVTALLFSVMLFLAQGISFSMEDYLLSSVYGGVLVGVGLGLVLRTGSTTGGVELIASLLHLVWKRPSLTVKIFLLDAAIILSGMAMFGGMNALYAILSVYIAERCMKYILEGADVVRGAVVITDKAGEIAVSLQRELGREVAQFQGKNQKVFGSGDLLFCIFSQQEIQAAKNVIMKTDASAFFLLMDVREILGDEFPCE